MPRYSPALIDQIRAQTDVVSIVGQRVNLEESGGNYKGLCPFHNEKTPSFVVYPESSSYYCFGCKASGTAIDFLIETENVSFPEAIERLAQMAGVTLPKSEGNEIRDEFAHLHVLLQRASDFYQSNLNQAAADSLVMQYIKRRGLSQKVVSQYAVGFAPSGWENIKNYLSDAVEKDVQSVGLTKISRTTDRVYDHFRNRLMFPIRNLYGKVIGFGGRVIDDEEEPKYLNSPRSPVFDKGSELYGFYEATRDVRRIPRLVLVEGYMDVLMLAQYGINYTVATLGTATSDQHFRQMYKRTNEVICCFDADNAGRNAAWSALSRALSTLSNERAVRFVFLPDGHDPDSFIRKNGKDAFERYLDDAIHVSDYFVRHLANGQEIKSVQERVRFVDEVTKLILTVPHYTTQVALKQEVAAHFPDMEKRMNQLIQVNAPNDMSETDSVKIRHRPKLKLEPYLCYLFHSYTEWPNTDLNKQLSIENRDTLADLLPDSLLIDVWDRIVKDNMTNQSSLLASYQGSRHYQQVRNVANQTVKPVSIEDFHDGIQTLITEIRYRDLKNAFSEHPDQEIDRELADQ